MFTKITPTADSQLSNEDVANLIVGDALDKLSKLTSLNQKEAFALLVNQVNLNTDDVGLKQTTKIQTPLLEQNESLFISNLFNQSS